MTNNDYQLEELEDAAVNKSNNAKRIAVAGGLFAAGGAVGYAATNIPVDSESEAELLTEEDLKGVADAGASQVHEPEVKPQPQTPPQAPKSEPEAPKEEVDISFDKTTLYYDENQNLVGTAEQGTLNGHDFILVDVDNDMRADILAYDADGNGVYNEDEIIELSGNDQIAMGHATTQHDVEFLAVNTPDLDIELYPDSEFNIDNEKDLAYSNEEIHNDFEDEKTGEDYSHDYAENNENYNNNGDVEHYSANSHEYAYEDMADNMTENVGFDDDRYSDFADATDDSSEDMTPDDFGSDSIDFA